jgi:hypothetical protein
VTAVQVKVGVRGTAVAPLAGRVKVGAGKFPEGDEPHAVTKL